MNIKCLLGHQWRAVPRFKPRHLKDRHNLPDKICLRCFKEKRTRYVLIVKSIEGPGLGYYMGPQWEGQNPPAGYDSWDEYWERMEIAKRRLIEKMR